MFAEPPDAAARREILRTAGKSILLSPTSTWTRKSRTRRLRRRLCGGLLREAARYRDVAFHRCRQRHRRRPSVARETVRASLDPLQVASLRVLGTKGDLRSSDH